MPKVDGSGSIRQRPDGRWEARFSTGQISPKTGKPIRKSIYGNTRREVAAALRKAVREVDNGTYLATSKMPLSVWADTWLKTCEGRVKYGTLKNYRAAIETHIKPRLGGLRLCDIRSDTLSTFYSDLLKEGATVPKRDPKTGKTVKNKDGKTETETAPLSPKTVRNIHGVMTQLLSTAADDDLIAKNPADKLKKKLPRVEKQTLTAPPLTHKQMQDFLKAIDNGEEYRRLFQFLLFTGARLSEATGLEWTSIDYKNCTISITQQLVKKPKKDGGVGVQSPKGNRPRVLHPPQFVFDMLKQRKQEQNEQHRSSWGIWEKFTDSAGKQHDLVFTTETGSYLSPQTVYNHLIKVMASIGVEDVTVHDLRHQFACNFLEASNNLYALQAELGHATASFTLDRYGHISDMLQKKSENARQDFIVNLLSEDKAAEG